MTHPIVDLFRIALRHRGDRAAILAELEAEKEWARFCARHGLPRDTDRPEGRSPVSSIVDEAPDWEAAGPAVIRLHTAGPGSSIVDEAPDWEAAVDGATANSTAVVFTGEATETITAWSLWSSQTGDDPVDCVTGRPPKPGAAHWATGILSGPPVMVVQCHCGHEATASTLFDAVSFHIEHTEGAA